MSVDFQRFESVRARQRSERRRWLTILSALAATVVAVAVMQIAGPMLPSWRELQAWSGDGPATLAETRGRVETVERDTRTIRIASGFLGLTSVALVITDDTLIVVGDKEGGFGDIRLGEPVVAAYEVRPGAGQAKRVEVVLPPRASGP